MPLDRFKTLGPGPTPAPDLDDWLGAKVQVDTASKALVLAAAAIEDQRWVSVRPLPLGRYEVRVRDSVWLEREAAKL